MRVGLTTNRDELGVIIETCLLAYEDRSYSVKQFDLTSVLSDKDFHHIDVWLLDSVGYGKQVFLMLEQFRSRKSLLIGNITNSDQVLDFLRSGAAGYLLENNLCVELVHALQTVSLGHIWVSRLPADKIEKPVNILTAHEKEVLDMISLGLTNRQTAIVIGTSERTVRAHVSHLLIKLGVNNRTQAAVFLLSQNRSVGENE